MSFAGLRVLSLESRRAREIETLIRRHNGDPFVAPSVRERALEDHSDAFLFVEQLEQGKFDLLVCTTGVGLSFLRDLVSRESPAERLPAALRRVTIVSRGPKPKAVLAQMSVPVHVTIPEPNTWREIVPAIAARPERRIAIQEYGRSNRELIEALEDLGATVTPFAIYRWEFPEDLEPLREAVRRIASHDCDVVLFTSSIQLEHLLVVAREMELEEKVREALKSVLAVASVGPIMTAALEEESLPADIVPAHPKMGALVKAAAEESAQVLARKHARVNML